MPKRDLLRALDVKNAKPKKKTYKLSDGAGLHLEITPSGSKRWRFRYRFQQREQMLSLGIYPDVTLKDARRKLMEARNQVANGINPSRQRQIDIAARKGAKTFQEVALEWHKGMVKRENWSEGHREQLLNRFKRHIFPWLGRKKIQDIESKDVLLILRRIEKRGHYEMAHRTKGLCGQVFRYAARNGMIKRDITQELRGALLPAKPKNYPRLTDPKEVGILMNLIDEYSGYPETKCALKLAALTFVRPGELRKAEWAEIDFKEAKWKIPAQKMKSKKDHIVPLSKQSLEVIKEVRARTGGGKYLFPNTRNNNRPMSDATINNALRHMGYSKEKMTGHGFRGTAKTLLTDEGWARGVTEKQLAHKNPNLVEAAYDHSLQLDKRTEMMQWWADYLDELRDEANQREPGK